MFPVKKEPNPSPCGRSWEQDKSSQAAWSAAFRENSKWWTKIHTRLTWLSRVKKVIQQFYWFITFFGFNWGQSYLATLVTLQNCTKMLRNLTFVVQFSYFSIRPKNVFVFSSNFWATFVTKSNFWLCLEQLFEKFRETFWKISSNLPGKLYQPWPINTCYCEQIQEGTTWKRGLVTYGALLQIWLYSP